MRLTLPRLGTAAAATSALALTATLAGATLAGAAPASAPDTRSGTSARATYAELAGPTHARKPSKPAGPAAPVKLDLLALNDFHGNLEPVPSTSSSGRIGSTPAGGAAYLEDLVEKERARSKANGASSLTVAAGDLIGASPLLSAAFHDEPTIKAMNKLGLDVSSVGNHEFDEGWRELRRMQNGGCLPDGPDGADGQNSCPGDQGFEGADFPYLGANVQWDDQGDHARPSVFAPYKVFTVKGQKVAFIGMTLEGTASIVSQAGIQGLHFTDEVETANALVPELRAKGVKSIVVLLHEGVTPADQTAYNDCSGVSGPALAIAQGLSPAIDAVVSGHTHQAYNCVVADPQGQPRLLTSASSFGRMITKIHLLIDPRTHDVVRPAEYASNVINKNTDGATADTGMQRLIDTYKTLVQPIADKVIGHLADTDVVSKTPDSNGGDSPLGNLVADGQLADPTVVEPDGTKPVVALMNPGGIRADLVATGSDHAVTYGNAFSVQPFNNFVVSMDLTGAEIRTILEQQWNGANEGTGKKILQVAGLSYTWDESDAALTNTPAVVGDVMIDTDGDPSTPMVAMDDATTYRVVANNFLSDGGDNFAGFKEGDQKLVGGLDIDSLRLYLEAHDPLSPPTTTDRISSQP